MLAQHPHIAGNRDRRLRRLRHRVFIRQAGGRLRLRVGEQVCQFVISEADHVQVKAVLLERLQFDAQHLLVPAGIHRQLVVGQNKRAPLCFGQMIEHDDRNFGHAQFAGGQQAGVAGDNDPVGAGKDRVRPAEFGNGCRDLGDLFVTMRARIPGERDQLLDRPRHHLQVRHALFGSGVDFWNRPKALCSATIWLIIGTTRATSFSKEKPFARSVLAS